MADDEDGDDEKKNGGIVSFFAVALPRLDGNEDSDIEKYEEHHGNETKQ